MGRASSAKKVARAARAGGSATRERPKIGFPLAVFAIVVLGTSLVVFARTSREPAAANPPSYLNNDHWHAAYGVYVCDSFLPSWSDAIQDRDGIHTHQDGVVHVHPFSASVSGDKARWKVFAEQVGAEFTGDGFIAPDGTTYENGYDCNGQPAKVSLYKWYPDDPTRPGDVYDSDLGDVAFDTDRAAYTLAVVPDGVVPPLPDSVPTLDNLTDVAGSGAGAQGLDPSTFDPSQLQLDPNTGQPVLPTDSSVIPTDSSVPVTDAPATGAEGETTPTSAADSSTPSSTP